MRREGWRVAACATSEASFAYAERNLGEPIAATATFVAEIFDRQSCRELIQTVEDQLGPLSLLVNNAATNDRVPLEQVTEASAQKIIAVNFLAPLWLTI